MVSKPASAVLAVDSLLSKKQSPSFYLLFHQISSNPLITSLFWLDFSVKTCESILQDFCVFDFVCLCALWYPHSPPASEQRPCWSFPTHLLLLSGLNICYIVCHFTRDRHLTCWATVPMKIAFTSYFFRGKLHTGMLFSKIFVGAPWPAIYHNFTFVVLQNWGLNASWSWCAST